MSASAAVEAQPAVTTAVQGAKITRLGGLKLRIKLPPKHPGLPSSSPGPDGSQQPSTSGRSSVLHSSPSGAAAPAFAGNGVASAATGPAWDLGSAVAQMCSQGIRGLGATLLSPWRHIQLEPLRQDNKRSWDATAVPVQEPMPTAKRQRLEGKGAAYAAAAEAAAVTQAAVEAGKPAPAKHAAGAVRPSSAGSRRQRTVLTEDDFGQPASPPSSRALSRSPVHRQQQKRSQGNRTRRRTALQLEDDDEEEGVVSNAAKVQGTLAPAQQAQQAAAEQQQQQQQQHTSGGRQPQEPVQQTGAAGSPSPHPAEPAADATAKRKSPAPADDTTAGADAQPSPKRLRPAAAPAVAETAPAPAAAPAAALNAPASASQVAVAAQDEQARSASVDSRPQLAAAPNAQEQLQPQPQQEQHPAPGVLADSAAPVTVAPAPAPPAPTNSQQLYDFGPLPLSGAAAALSSVSLVPPKLERKSIANIKSVGEALPFLDALQESARKLKKSGDKGVHANHHWDVRSLAYYTLSGITFIEYAGYHAALQAQLRASGVLMDAAGRPGVLPNMSPLLLQQTADMLNVAVTASSTAQGSDLAKQGIRVLMERLMAICHMRHLQQHQNHLRHHVQRVRQGVRAAQAGAVAVAPVPVPPAPQQRTTVYAPTIAPHTKGMPVPLGSSGKRRSPDDSLQSTQERLPDQQPSSSQQQSAGSSRVAPNAVPSGGAAGTPPLPAVVLASQSHVVAAMQQALRMTDLMHQTVMRLQQFLERPEVQACVEAKQAAVHISTVGLDAGMYSIDHVAAHARAAVRCLLSLDVAAARASAGGARRGV